MNNRFWDRLDLAEESGHGQTIVEIVADRRVLIEHHLGVFQYDTCHIAIKTSRGKIVVVGNELGLTLMTKEQLVISGKIESIHLGSEE